LNLVDKRINYQQLRLRYSYCTPRPRAQVGLYNESASGGLMLTLILTLALSLNAQAHDFVWYEVSQLDCATSKGLRIKYDQTKDVHNLQGEGFGGIPLYPNGAKLNLKKGYTEINFTSHQPSAGPVINESASNYSLRYLGGLRGEGQKIWGYLMESQSFGPWKLLDRFTCTVTSREIFSRK